MPTFLLSQESHLVSCSDSRGISNTSEAVITNASQDDVVHNTDKNVLIPINNVTLTAITPSTTEETTKMAEEKFG